MGLTQEKKAEIFAEHGGSASNTGSIEGQIALFTERINQIAEHLKVNKNDHSSRLSLVKMVGKRKRLLRYLSTKDITKYRELLKTLGLRK